MADDFNFNNPYSAPQSSGQIPPIQEGGGLKSLGQEARKSSLNKARWTMIIIGLLTIVMNGLAQFSIHKQIAEIERRGGMADPDSVRIATLVNYTFVGIGTIFIVMGITVHQYPVPITIAALVLYVLCTIVAFILSPELSKNFLAIVIRAAIILGFWKSVQSAQAYEKERRMAPYQQF